MIERELQAWVRAEMGGAIVGSQRVGSGASRATWLLEIERAGGEPQPLVLRVDTGDGPLSGTVLDLAREAVIYHALCDSPVRAPRLLAAHPAGQALLIERATGSDAFLLAVADAQREIACDYMAALADLHRLDVERLELPGIDRPRDSADCAGPDLALWRRILNERVAVSDPLFDFGGQWLAENAPENGERISLCHGDAGPGNFLFEGERVTALLDWEFAHLGDPLDDLAWVAVRGQLLGGFGEWSANLARWSERSGLQVDLARIEYYRALVLLRMAISCLAALAHAGERTMNTTVYAILLLYLRFLMPEALARAKCDDPRLAEFMRAGTEAIAASPVLRDHARTLMVLDAP